uniref:ribosomal protein S19 n=1 Tax=Helicotheca tamesis TaxID=374047 RepID=UPI0020288EBD|nr:ribosomal protein S19 [Helicotheca tamesis]QYB23028.1 ribosomal protein S19 [Helicotheca tamesis]
MSRSKWKGPFINKKSLLKNSLKIKSRNSTILPQFVNYKLKVHNGLCFSELLVIDEMVGHKFGELIATRKSFFFKKNK